jgi:glycosyltransferase involved in cell wall biosynthesis
MRIGLLGHGFIEWGGGIDFLRMVISSLHYSNDAVELHALVPTRGPKSTTMRALKSTYHTAKAVMGRASSMSPRPSARHIVDLANSAEQALGVHEIDIGMPAIAKAAKRLALDALVPAFAALPGDFPTPWVGYLYDFQHRYFPQHFTPVECAQRDTQFAAMLARASAVIVNARAVSEDILRFHPEAQARVFALPFGAAPQSAWLVPSESPAAKFGVEKPYFIICNQFWKHKDHGTAFAAFAQIAAAHPNVDLVCTGATNDYRDAGHFPALQRALARDALSHRVHILGMVPKTDQIALLKGSIALIQPTLFEGGPGGGAVFDAVSLGVRCLVSDIPVNRELSEPEISFFTAGDVASLAALLGAAIAQPAASNRDAEALRERGRARRAACGNTILAAIEYARYQRQT